MLQLNPLTSFYKKLNSYPSQFRVLMAITFIDSVGGAVMFPFFSLYLTAKFGVGMTQVGLLFTGYAIGNMIGSTLGGALTDTLGRKRVIVVALVGSALGGLAMGFLDSYVLFLALSWIVGILGGAGSPARQAMVADLLPEEQRSEGFAMLRMLNNLAVTVGPAIGGLLATRSYLLLFVSDAVMSLIAAVVVILVMKETKPAIPQEEEAGSVATAFGGYGRAFRDSPFILFIVACALTALVSMQMNSTLSVYLRDSHGVSTQGFGYILSLNAAMVVLFQFAITSALSRYPRLMILAAGTLLYGVGLAMYGFVSVYALFLVAMATITVGEMMFWPTAQSMASTFAPEDMRGRYMATFGYTHALTMMVGPLLSGLLMDNADPRWLWYVSGLLGLVGAGVFLRLRRRVEKRVASSTVAA